MLRVANIEIEPSLAEIDHLDSLHRQQLKLSAEERAILQDEPADVTKNLGILIALRSASEAADPQSRSLSQNKSRKRKGDVDLASTESPAPSSSGVSSDKLNRIKGGAQRSTSVSSSHRGDTASLDNGVEGGRPSEKADHLVIGAEVVFKHNKKQQGVEGEGIQCIIKNITGEGNKRRYAWHSGSLPLFLFLFFFFKLDLLTDELLAGMMYKTQNRSKTVRAPSTRPRQPR